MGMLDLNTKYSIAQAVTSTGDTASTNVFDTGSANSSDIGLNDELWINVTCRANATSGGSATVQAVLQDSADNSTFVDVLAGAVFPVASVNPGVALLQACPPLGLRRYTRIVYRVGVAALTAGTFDAFVSLDVQRNVARPSGFTAA